MKQPLIVRIYSVSLVMSMFLFLTACNTGDSISESAASEIIGVSSVSGIPDGEQLLLDIVSVIASSHDADRGRLPELAIDGDPATKWTALSMPQWFIADLGAPHWVSRLRMDMFVQRNGANAGYSIDISTDNKQWTNVLENGAPAAVNGWVDLEIDPVTARYVRLRLESSDENEYVNLSRFELYGRPQPARISDIDASSFDERNGRFPDLAIDGDLDTKWTALGMPQWLMLDLGSQHLISGNRMNLYIARAGINAVYSIDISEDGDNWTTVVTDSSLTMSPAWTEVSYSPVKGRYLRLRLDSSNRGDYVNLNQIEVYAAEIIESPPEAEAALNIAAVNASSYDTARNRLPELAIDGNPDTKWTALGMPQWIEADLGAAHMVSQLRMSLFVAGNGANASHDIDVSVDRDSWTTVLENASLAAVDGWVEARITPVMARYVRVRLRSSEPSDYINLSLFELYGKVMTTATIDGVTASDFDRANGRLPDYAIDGNLDTKWTALSLPESLTLDLGDMRSISGSRLYTYIAKGGLHASYSIDVSSDNRTWTTVLAGESLTMAPAWTEARFSQTVGRYVRFRIDSSNPGDYINLNAVEVYAQALPATTVSPPLTPEPSPEQPPSPPPVQDISNIPLTLTWRPSAGNVLGYRIYFGPSENSINTELMDIPNSLSSRFDPGNPQVVVDSWFNLRMLPGDNACFNLIAYNHDGFSGRSSPVCVAITEAL